MTTGDTRAVTEATAPKIASTRPGGQNPRQSSTVSLRPSRQSTVDPDQSTRQPSVASGQPSRQPSLAPVQSMEGRNAEMPPPPKPASVAGLRERRVLGIGRQTSQATTASNPDPDPESLFMPQGDDDDRRWDPPNLDEEEQEEMLGWDINADAVSYGFSTLNIHADVFYPDWWHSPHLPRCHQQRAATTQPKSQPEYAGYAAYAETFPSKHASILSDNVADFFRCTDCSTELQYCMQAWAFVVYILRIYCCFMIWLSSSSRSQHRCDRLCQGCRIRSIGL